MIDLTVVGGGIVGLATAWTYLAQNPNHTVVIVEKEAAVAVHQTGRNSGVIHSGIYYKPGSLKAETCHKGRLLLLDFCQSRGIPVEVCGKVIVATEEAELAGLNSLKKRGDNNGVSSKLLDEKQLREIEPHVRGVGALHVPEAGIVDYGGVSRRLALEIEDRGGQLHLGAHLQKLSGIAGGVGLHLKDGSLLKARKVLNCGGLYSDHIAKMAEAAFEENTETEGETAQIVPFRGEYFLLRPEAEAFCRGLIYPVPDTRYPFLGVHFTRMVGGGVECGPNAVLALAREGYTWGDVNLRELVETLTYLGFLRLAKEHAATGLKETWRSIFKGAFVKALQRLIPGIQSSHLIRAEAGVRAQALLPSGKLVDDFLVRQIGPITNIINAPSPAATASLAIGERIVSTYLRD